MNKNNEPFNSHGCMNSCCAGGLSIEAMFLGSLVGIGASFLLSLFFNIFNFSILNTNVDGSISFSFIGFIITLFVAVVSTFFGGWVAAYLGRNDDISAIRGIL